MTYDKILYPINTSKTIKAEFSPEEAAYIAEQAAKQKLSQRKYIRAKVLDTTTGVQELKSKIMREMPKYYTLVQQVENHDLHQALMDLGGALCRSLK